MIIGHVAVNFVPIITTFDEDYVEFVCSDINMRMERTFLSASLFGDFNYEEEDEA